MALLAAVLAVLVALALGGTAQAAGYPPNRSGAKQFAAAFCPSNPVGMADYVWLSAPSSEDVTTVTVVYPNTVVDVRVNAYVQYCSSYPWGADAGSSYWSNIGGPSGSFNYNNGYPNATWYDYQVKPLNVAGWEPGNHTICMTLASWSVGLFPQPSPSACSVLNLNIVHPWTTGGWSLIGVDHEPNVSEWNAVPGQRLTWRHGVYNNGPGRTGNIAFATNKLGFSNGWNGNIEPQGIFSLNPGQTQIVGDGSSPPRYQDYSAYDVTQADVGGRLCQSISWGPWAWNDGAWRASGAACANVPYNFNLTPIVNVSTQNGEPGATISPVQSHVSNSGPTKSRDATKWELTRFVIPKDGSKPAGADTRQSPCDYYDNGCTTIGSGNQTFMPGDTPLAPVSVAPIDDLPLGSQLCFALSVSGYNAGRDPNDGWWRHGAPDCIRIGKTPKLQVWGGDVAARGSISTSTTVKGADVFGSWVEYGAFSVGGNNGFASSAGLVGQTSSDQSSWSKLTFANVSSTGSAAYGSYASATDFRQLPSVASYFKSFTNTQPYGGALNDNAFATGGPITVRTAGNLTLGAGQLDAGKSVVIVADGTVTINGDITYAGGNLASFKDIPQLVIIAKDIRIEQGVKNVDAWLVASDTIDTCSNVGPAGQMPANGTVMKGDVCAELLTINGPVIANKLILKRTAGSGTDTKSGDPAEIINLRPDAYLWAQLVATGSGKAQTVYSVELPPRF
jgi:hypothetical protein